MKLNLLQNDLILFNFEILLLKLNKTFYITLQKLLFYPLEICNNVLYFSIPRENSFFLTINIYCVERKNNIDKVCRGQCLPIVF